MLLIGDAAGLAYPESGEGIRPAIESGRLAAAHAGCRRRAHVARRSSALRGRAEPTLSACIAHTRAASIRRCRRGRLLLGSASDSRDTSCSIAGSCGSGPAKAGHYNGPTWSSFAPLYRGGARHAAFGSERSPAQPSAELTARSAHSRTSTSMKRDGTSATCSWIPARGQRQARAVSPRCGPGRLGQSRRPREPEPRES